MPAYNAEKTLRRTFDEIPHDIVDTVLLVDDNSRDGTSKLAASMGIPTYVHVRNYGYGRNQKTCYAEALRLCCIELRNTLQCSKAHRILRMINARTYRRQGAQRIFVNHHAAEMLIATRDALFIGEREHEAIAYHRHADCTHK